MNPVTGLITFLLIWCLVFLGSLPFGVRGQWEDGSIAEGSEPGAPANPMIGRKLLWSTAVTAGIWLVIFAVVQSGLVDIYDLPGPDSYWE